MDIFDGMGNSLGAKICVLMVRIGSVAKLWENLCNLILLVVFILVLCIMISPMLACDNNLRMNPTLHANKNDTLMSQDGVFELGFYAGMWSDLAPTVHTLAIWYNQTILPGKTVVWMADRSINLSNNATLTLWQGDLQVYDAGQLMWSSNISRVSHLGFT